MRREIGLAATAFGLLAAVGYMAANICLRSVSNLDPVWVSCVKAIPTALATFPLVCLGVFRGRPLFSSQRVVVMTIAIAIFGQLGGNVCFQWSLGIVGLALSVPLTIGAMIVSGAVWGRLLLGDGISFRMSLASAILILAIGVLSLGAPTANATMILGLKAANPWVVAGGVGSACLSGVAYSSLSILLRYATNRGTPLSSLLFTVGAVGVLVLGSITWIRQGLAPMVLISSDHAIPLVGAGVFNLIGFWGLTNALQRSSVVFVNALNASQTAMAAIAGVLLFREPTTIALSVGVGLTVIGLLITRGPRRPHRNRQSRPSTNPGDLPADLDPNTALPRVGNGPIVSEELQRRVEG